MNCAFFRLLRFSATIITVTAAVPYYSTFVRAELIETLTQQYTPLQPPDSRIGHYSNVGEAIGDVPGTILFWAQLAFIGPQNAEKFSAAVASQLEQMAPGETRKIAVVGRRVGESMFFAYIAKLGEPSLNAGDEILLGVYELQKPDKVLSVPLSPFTEEALNKCIEKGLCGNEIKYGDHVFAVDYWNGMHGTTDGVTFVDVKDRKAYSGMSAKILLMSRAVDDKYSVFNAQTGQTEMYNKGQSIKKRGNTVWLLTKSSDGKEYTAVYNNLSEIAPGLQVGATVEARKVLGTYYDDKNSGTEIWRVDGPQQYFLNNGAYRVSPVN